MRSSVVTLVALLAATACSQSEVPEAEPMKVEDSVFGDMTSTMDKAKSVEATTMERKHDVDRALDEAQ